MIERIQVTVHWEDGEKAEESGYRWSIVYGDGTEQQVRPQPWMLEAISVAERALKATRARVEDYALAEFAKRAEQQRKFRRQVQEQIALERAQVSETKH